jgi:hypothetical protein
LALRLLVDVIMPDATTVDPGKLSFLVQVIGAIGALGAAAYGLVDASKAFRGGVSNVGYADLVTALERFAAALERALAGGAWRDVVYAHWINGRPRDEQKAIAKSLIRLGIHPDVAPQLAAAAHVEEAPLRAVAEKLRMGAPLTEQDVQVLGRLDASVEAYVDAAFDRADQRYRSVARFLAGAIAVVLALVATWALDSTAWARAVLIGLLAVPLAPVAKDLASSLSSAAQAVRAGSRQP